MSSLAALSILNRYREKKRQQQAPRLLAELEEKITAMHPGEVIGHRIPDTIDWTGKGDLTIIVYCGRMDPKKLRDVQDVFSGVSTGRRRPGKGAGA